MQFMALCNVCEKQIPDGASVCSLNCLRKDSVVEGVSIQKSNDNYLKSINKMIASDKENRNLSKIAEVPVMKVKHRWKRNKMDMVDSVIFAFDGDGVATIPDVGSNKYFVDLYVQKSNGSSWVLDDEKKVEPEVKNVVKDSGLKKPVENFSIVEKPVVVKPIQVSSEIINNSNTDKDSEDVLDKSDEKLVGKKRGPKPKNGSIIN